VRALVALALIAAVQSPAPVRFDAARAWKDLAQLVAIGPRPAGSPAIDKARQYITAQLTAAGVKVAEQAWTDRTPLGQVRMVNLRATIPGASPTRLIVAGHYDTKRFTDIRFLGANDGGSSAAFLIELARALKGRRNALTIELLFLDGEEAVVEWRGTDRTYGSRFYVQAAQRDGSLRTIRALILVDMIADRDLQFKRDLNSTPWLTSLIWNAARRQTLDRYFSDEATAIEDDHLPFLEAGIPSIDIIDLEFAPWHTAGDTLDAIAPRGLQVVGDTLIAALPDLEQRLK
jgi:Zn-dependent M28 family amino/carboxypeptidase